MSTRRIVIVGATSAIAEHCARRWVTNSSVHMTLLGRDASRIDRVATDLRVRSPASTINVVAGDFIEPAAIQSVVDVIAGEGSPDVVLIAHGLLPDQSRCQERLQLCRDALEINGLSPVLFAEGFAKHMAAVDHGTIALIGSVAGDRGRKSNYVYGAAKGLVARYAEGMQHRFAGSGVRMVLIKPGPTDTPMTAHLKEQGARLASVEDVAQQIVDGISEGASVLYVPRKWQLIMMIIRHLPRYVFNRLNI